MPPGRRLLTVAQGEFELGNDGPSVILVGVDETVTASRELGISMSFVSGQGDPYREIARLADEVRADAIVVVPRSRLATGCSDRSRSAWSGRASGR